MNQVLQLRGKVCFGVAPKVSLEKNVHLWYNLEVLMEGVLIALIFGKYSKFSKKQEEQKQKI